MFPFFPDAKINDLQMLWGDSSGSFCMMAVSGRGVEVHLWASLSGCSLISDCIGETFCSFVILINVGTSWSEVHLRQQPENKWWNHPYGSFGNWWGGSGKPGHGDYLLPPWPGKGGVTGSALHLTPARLSWTNVVVMKIFGNSPYLPWGPSSFLYLDITALSLGAFTTQFPLYCLYFWQLLPYSLTQVVLPHEEEDEELKVYPFLQEALWESSEEEHHLSDPVLLLVPPSPFSLHQEESS